MPQPRRWFTPRLNEDWLAQCARTTITALVSLIIGRVLRLPEAYWAPLTAIVVMQSTLGAALTVSGQRFVGTVLGAAAGALITPYFGSNIYAYGVSIFVLGLICAVLGMGKSSYRFAGITLSIVMLVARTEPAWIVALHRFIEVSLGIAVGLAVTAVWPQRERAAA